MHRRFTPPKPSFLRAQKFFLEITQAATQAGFSGLRIRILQGGSSPWIWMNAAVHLPCPPQPFARGQHDDDLYAIGATEGDRAMLQAGESYASLGRSLQKRFSGTEIPKGKPHGYFNFGDAGGDYTLSERESPWPTYSSFQVGLVFDQAEDESCGVHYAKDWPEHEQLYADFIERGVIVTRGIPTLLQEIIQAGPESHEASLRINTLAFIIKSYKKVLDPRITYVKKTFSPETAYTLQELVKGPYWNKICQRLLEHYTQQPKGIAKDKPFSHSQELNAYLTRLITAIQSAIAQLAEKTKAVESSIQAATEKSKENDRIIAELEASLKKSEEDKLTLIERNRKQSEKLQQESEHEKLNLQQKTLELEDELKNARARHSQLNLEVAPLKAKLGSLEKDLKKSNMLEKQQAQSLMEENKKLKLALANKEKQIGQLNEQIQQKTNERDKVERETASLAETHQKEKEALAKKHQEVVQARQQLKNRMIRLWINNDLRCQMVKHLKAWLADHEIKDTISIHYPSDEDLLREAGQETEPLLMVASLALPFQSSMATVKATMVFFKELIEMLENQQDLTGFSKLLIEGSSHISEGGIHLMEMLMRVEALLSTDFFSKTPGRNHILEVVRALRVLHNENKSRPASIPPNLQLEREQDTGQESCSSSSTKKTLRLSEQGSSTERNEEIDDLLGLYDRLGVTL